MILGIDTSNYTTSVAVVSEEQQLLFDQRIVLDVKEGERGLQQSVAVFQHLHNLPELLQEAVSEFRSMISGVCYSSAPRPIEGSYMPVFKVGEGYGNTLAVGMNVPLFMSTHQEGHIAAGLWSSGFQPDGSFLAMHLSGGTTDLLLVKPLNGGFQIELLGSSLDLHAGQFVDRIGVKLGCNFPAGKELESLAYQVDEQAKVSLPASVQEYQISFSGPCSAAERLIDQGTDGSTVAYAVFRCIANSLEKVLVRALAETQITEVLFVGGVASNSLIRERLIHRLAHPAIKAKLYFADPLYCRDNAVGVALLGLTLNKLR